MKIAVVGCGALGSYYGAKLCRDGHEVHFLLRSDFDVARSQGIRIQSVDGDFSVRPHCARMPQEIGPSDLVLIGLKTTANSEFKNLLPSLVGAQTAILTLQNGLGNEEALASLFPPEQIMGGLCYVCLNRLAPAHVCHLSGGLIVMGQFQRPPDSRTHQIAELIRHSGVPCKVSENLALAHWEKLVWNIPFNGLGVAACAGYEAMAGTVENPKVLQACLATDELLSDPRWEELVREVMLEIIAGANALGLSVPRSLAEKQIALTRTLGHYKASTLIDFERGQPLELTSLFLEPLRMALEAGVSAPRLQRLCHVLGHFCVQVLNASIHKPMRQVTGA